MTALAALPRRKFTVDEYHYFIEKGVFAPEERLELWEGELIEMSPIGKLHAGCVNALNAIFSRIVNQNAVASVQNPIILDNLSEPEPDICLLKPRADFYRREKPKAADVLIAVEVADTTIDFDRNHKLPAYARNGIVESWLIDLTGDRVEIHSQPKNQGYSLVQILHRGDMAKSGVLPEIEIAISDILG